jgi:hypothetical protein
MILSDTVKFLNKHNNNNNDNSDFNIMTFTRWKNLAF